LAVQVGEHRGEGLVRGDRELSCLKHLT
jgi:hypothetical protein